VNGDERKMAPHVRQTQRAGVSGPRAREPARLQRADAMEIDEEVKRLVMENYERAKRLLTENMTSLKRLAKPCWRKKCSTGPILIK